MDVAVSSGRLVTIACGLFYLNAGFWLGIGAVSLLRMTGRQSGQTVVVLIVALLVVANAAAMLVAGLGLAQRRRLTYGFALAVLVVNIVLTFTDEFGIGDLITLVIDLVLLGLVISVRTHYLAIR